MLSQSLVQDLWCRFPNMKISHLLTVEPKVKSLVLWSIVEIWYCASIKLGAVTERFGKDQNQRINWALQDFSPTLPMMQLSPILQSNHPEWDHRWFFSEIWQSSQDPHRSVMHLYNIHVFSLDFLQIGLKHTHESHHMDKSRHHYYNIIIIMLLL